MLKALSIAATTSITLSTNATKLEFSMDDVGDLQQYVGDLHQEIEELDAAIVDAAAAYSLAARTAAAASEKALTASESALAATKQDLAAAAAAAKTQKTAAAASKGALAASESAHAATKEDLTAAVAAAKTAGTAAAAAAKTAAAAAAASKEALADSKSAHAATDQALTAAKQSKEELTQALATAAAEIGVWNEKESDQEKIIANMVAWEKLQAHESQPCENGWTIHTESEGWQLRAPCDWEQPIDKEGWYFMDIGGNPRDAIWRANADQSDELRLQADLSSQRPGGVHYESRKDTWNLMDKYHNIVAVAGEY